jgi:membrane-bound serine protease (ClpP class)
MILFRTSSAENFASLSWSVIIGCTTATALFFLFVIGMGIKAQRWKPATGVQALIGETGESVNQLDPFGLVKVHGEMWKAESVSGKINEGEKVVVKAINNLTLHVGQMQKSTS